MDFADPRAGVKVYIQSRKNGMTMSEKPKVLVKFFASARDTVGEKDLKMEIKKNSKVEDVMENLFEEYPDLQEMEDHLLISVNKDRTGKDEILKDGDEIAVMPPVTGG